MTETLIYAVRAAGRQEKVVALMMKQKAIAEGLDVYAIAFNDRVQGYILVEVKDEDTLYKLIKGIKYVKGVIKNPLPLEEVERMLKFKKEVKEKIEVGDIVEIISGPFKGEKAKVTALNEEKGVYTVLPIEVAIAIPVNLEGKMLRLVKKANEE